MFNKYPATSFNTLTIFYPYITKKLFNMGGCENLKSSVDSLIVNTQFNPVGKRFFNNSNFKIYNLQLESVIFKLFDTPFNKQSCANILQSLTENLITGYINIGKFNLPTIFTLTFLSNKSSNYFFKVNEYNIKHPQSQTGVLTTLYMNKVGGDNSNVS